MKRIGILLGACIMLSISSCKKDWVCNCTDQDGNASAHTINNQTLLNARAHCKAMDYDNTTFGIHTSLSCGLN